MDIYTKEEAQKNKEKILFEIESGAVFVYPTDTIYGIGCNALDSFAVRKIRQIKKRNDKPFSIIAPNIKWIEDHCIVDSKNKKWLKKLPGKYTFVFKLRDKFAVAREVCNGTIGVRIPKHWISELANTLHVPIVTTSVNKSGKEHITQINKISKSLVKQLDFAIDEGILKGKASTVVDMMSGKVLRK